MDKLKVNNKFWLWLGKNTKIGSAGFAEILSHNIPFEYLYTAKKSDLLSRGLSERIVKEIIFCQENIDPDKVVEELEKREIKFTTIKDDDYPELLKEIYNPPAILYYKGTLHPDSFCVAVVGSRRPTDYGAGATREIASTLSKKGITIVSGMAIGIDSIAHQATLDSDGVTIAVLGCGLDQIYPSRNVQMAKHIQEKGSIVSAFPIGVPPLKFNFPLRNRIISGLSTAVVVTEAAERSGSLITATIALEQNKDIFALPGSIYNKNSIGPNNLIRMGAKVITKTNDILDELGLEIENITKELPKGDSAEEDIIIKLLIEEPKHIDAITKRSKLDQKKVSECLTLMEISGKIRHTGGMVYRLNA